MIMILFINIYYTNKFTKYYTKLVIRYVSMFQSYHKLHKLNENCIQYILIFVAVSNYCALNYFGEFLTIDHTTIENSHYLKVSNSGISF